MRYAIKIAWRYLSSSPLQSWLLILGVAVGVFVFVFMSALIGGLAVYIVDRTIGNVAHVTIASAELTPKNLYDTTEGALVAIERSTSRERLIRYDGEIVRTLQQFPDITAISPQLVGNGFATQGAVIKPVNLIGVEPANLSAIADVSGHLVEGRDDLPIGTALIGRKLAEDLGVQVGQQVRIRSDRGVEKALTLRGIFFFDVDVIDERTVYLNLKSARLLMATTNGVNRIEMRLNDLWKAPDVAGQIEAVTDLDATAWTENNGQLLSGLDAQARSGDVIKGFALVTIVIGVASAMLLTTFRRRSEIGIMRAMGSPRGFVITVFLLQGAMIGSAGALLGAATGFAVLSPFPPPTETVPGRLPIDVTQGGYFLAAGLTLLGALIASILPARAASKVDPVEVIQQ